MNPLIEHAGVKFELLMSEEPELIKDRGWVHPAMLIGSYPREKMQELVGMSLLDDKVIGVDSFSTMTVSNCRIGFLLKQKHWGKE